jgi:type VI secretion system secreted protein VgrG
MATYTQAGRPLRVISSLADDELMLVGFSGEEGMSMIGGFSLDLCSPKATLAAKDFLMQPMGVVIEASDGTKRYLNGIVRRFGMTGQSDDLTLYRAEIVPWLWYLSVVQDCKIFQNLSVPDIVEQVFKDHGFNDFEARLLKTYPKREYTVQYRESCLSFVSRLLEDEGIFYFFEHGAKKHTLVLADNSSKVVACPGIGKVTMIGGASATADADTLESMHEEEQVTTGKVAYGDFNFLTPTSRLRLEEAGTKYGKLEYYEYPGGYLDPDEGNRYVGLKLEEFESSQRVAFGSGSCRAFTAGHKFALSDHPRKEMNIDWTLLRVSHTGHNGDYRSSSGSGEDSYSNSFVAMPHSVRFLPPEVTPRPRMHGTQTATVVGKSGEEIWTDKYGRVKVQFHWDRDGKQNENSSLWVRVSTPWSGKNWGMIAIPRIGQEVVVDFLEGDPDRPLIVGMVYNADFMPPWELPANQTQSGILTRSTKGGGAANANELRFEDKKGSEEIFMHAEKQLTTEVEADEIRTVGANRTTTIQKDDKRINKEGNEITVIEKGSSTTTIEKDQLITVKSGISQLVVETGDSTEIVEKGAHGLGVRKGDSQYDVETGKLNIVVRKGDQLNYTEMGKLVHQVSQGDMDTVVKMGNVKVQAKLGKISFEAMQEIELKVGQSSIKIDNTGVTIKGMMVKVEGQVQTSIKGLMTEVKGDAMLQAKGAITMIG